MNILTNTEITECLTGGPTAVARAIEAAILSRLAAAPMPQPGIAASDLIGVPTPGGLYTEAQLKAYGAACAARQLSSEPVAWMHPMNATCVTTDPTAYARGIPLHSKGRAIP